MFNNFFVFNNFKMKFAVLQRKFKNDKFDTKHFRISQKMNVTDFLRVISGETDHYMDTIKIVSQMTSSIAVAYKGFIQKHSPQDSLNTQKHKCSQKR